MLTQELVPPSAGQDDASGQKVNAEQFYQLALSRRKLSRQQRDGQQMLVDNETGVWYWIEEVEICSCAVYR